ncbi:MAG: hypothetical protein H6734_15065 [Alphaproteobacteria bacterium]|nr:hypothetical protein [Alphaproteobacteria bacterium]
MNVLLVVTLTGGWTLESDGGAYAVDHRRVCTDGACSPVGEVQVRDDGVWSVGEVEVRWDTPTTARMRRGAGPWVAARLKSPVAGESPWKGTPGEGLTVGSV